MKAYVVTTGVIFVLITVAHVMRFFAEPKQISDPLYLLLTVLSAGLSIWAVSLFMRLKRSS